MTRRKDFQDLTNKKIGKWLVRSYHSTTKHRDIKWLCLCECGYEGLVFGTSLRHGRSLKCRKCAWMSLRHEYGEACKYNLLLTYKKSARLRNIEFNLNNEEFYNMTKQNCYYCDVPPAQIKRAKLHYGEYLYNGIDRVDNTKGYINTNCVPCCKECNYNKVSVSINIARKMIEFCDTN